MDARVNPHALLGLEEGDAHVISNAGGVITDDEIRSLAISQRLLGTEEIVLDPPHRLRDARAQRRGRSSARSRRRPASSRQWPVGGLSPTSTTDVRESLERIRESPFIPRKDSVRGFVYEVETGRLREVDQ